MGIWIPTIQNSETFEIQSFVGRISNGWALAMEIAFVPTIRKPGHLKSGCFCPYFNWFLASWWPFVRISHGWASVFQIPFKILCNPTSFLPFEIQTSQDFRSPLYCMHLNTRSIWWPVIFVSGIQMPLVYGIVPFDVSNSLIIPSLARHPYCPVFRHPEFRWLLYFSLTV